MLMADRSQRSNREKRKPKAAKKDGTAIAATSFSSVVSKQKPEKGKFGK
jgi:hypothetical protein